MVLDDRDLLARLDELMRRIPQGAEDGLAAFAPSAQAQLQATTAHGDVTGATRASYRVFLVGGVHTGAAEAASGYEAAKAQIEAYPKRAGGEALSQAVDVALGPDERGLIYTAYTDYQDKLETENAGQKATLGPTLQATAQDATRAAADGIRRRMQ